MYRGLAEEQPRKGEEDYTFQFEAPHFITLGMHLRAEQALRRRRLRADPEARGQVPVRHLRQDAAGARGRARSRCARPTRRWARWWALRRSAGISHPFVKNYVLARTTPLTRQRKTLPVVRPGLREAARQPGGLRLGEGALRRDPQRAAQLPPAADEQRLLVQRELQVQRQAQVDQHLRRAVAQARPPAGSTTSASAREPVQVDRHRDQRGFRAHGLHGRFGLARDRSWDRRRGRGAAGGGGVGRGFGRGVLRQVLQAAAR